MTRISHRGKETFLQCGEKYRLHYIERLRSPILASPLFLGKSFDEALNVLLLRKKPLEKLTEEDKELVGLDPHEVLDKELTRTELNGKEIHIPDYIYCKYYNKDFDPELLEEEDLMMINSTADELGFEHFDLEICKEFVQDCKNEIKTKKSLEENSQV